MKIDTAYTAHLGGRDEQQDAVTVLERPDGSECLVVLADGMGGHAGGSLASRTVVEVAERIWRDEGAPAEPRALLAHLCQAAHDAINQAGEDHNQSPRSTCVLLHLRDGMANWAHIGDSRLYRFRNGEQLGRTRDHSVVQMLLDMGKISEEEMGTHPDQNRLTQSLGGDTDPEPDFGSDAAGEGDAYILCSDGLWEMVKPEEMAEALAEAGLDPVPEKLAATAFDRAGRHSDNISVALVRLGQPVAAAAVAASEAPTRLAPAGAAVGTPARRKSGGGRMAIAFLFVGVLAVGAAAAVVRPWEDGAPYSADRARDAVAPKDAVIVPDKAPAPGERHKMRPPSDDRMKDRATPAPDAKKDASRQPAPSPAPDTAAPSRPDATPRKTEPAPDARVQPPSGTVPKAEPVRPPQAQPEAQPEPRPEPAPQTRPNPTPPNPTPPAEPGANESPPAKRSETRPPADPAPEVIRPGNPENKSGVRQPTGPSSKTE